MSLTPNSSATAYALPSDLLIRYDARQIGQLVNDDNTISTYAQLLAHPTVIELLNEASGMVEAACVIGQRYAPADLNALTGVSQSYLKRLVCNLAFGLMRMRRGIFEEAMMVAYLDAMSVLEKLRTGDVVFAFVETEAAGLPKTSIYTSQDIANLNLVSSRTRYFGLRQNSLRGGSTGSFQN